MSRYAKGFALFIGLVAVWGVATFWLMEHRPHKLRQKRAVVRLLGLPDLAMSTEAHAIRHRSLSNLFDVFGYGPSLLPYFPSDFIYAPPPYLDAKDRIR